ncbi:unnamed protein product [Lota lota]
MVMKWIAVYLVTVAMLGELCNARFVRSKPGYNPNRVQKPANTPQVQEAKTAQEPMVQSKVPVEAPLRWTYPLDPVEKPKPNVPFVQRTPVDMVMVAVECREKDIRVDVKTALFGGGQLNNPSELTLGSCIAVGFDNAAQVLIFESELQECGSSLRMNADYLIYSYILNYNPQTIGGTPVIRTTGAAILVECHYPRKHNVSSNPLDPLWNPFSAIKVSNELLYFTLVLKTDDWMYDRPSYQYFLGDMINIEATVKQFMHVPLRVYVDSCIATLQPNSRPEYKFIENFGCLVDAKLTGSTSTFLPRLVDNALKFQLEAFMFHGATSGLLYITCNLKATSVAFPIDEQHRACSFKNGWKEASGVNRVCGSCDVGGTGPADPVRKGRDVSMVHEMVEWETVIHLDAIHVSQREA